MLYQLRLYLFSIMTTVMCICVTSPAHAITFTSITAIGDSLVDGGSEETAVISAYKLYGQSTSASHPEYYNSKFCNRYVTAEYFAYFMGMYNKEQFFNYGVAGASTENLPDILDHIYDEKPTLDPTGLYVIWIGAHDIFKSTISREQSAENIKQSLISMQARGAKYFMVMNLPRLDTFPNYQNVSPAGKEAARIAYQAFNTALSAKLNELSFKNNVVQFDTAEFFGLIPLYGTSVGFTNLTDACFTVNGGCATPDTYIFWDDVHLTDKLNSFLGYHMKSKLEEANLK